MIKIEINTQEAFASVEFDGEFEVICTELLMLNSVAFSSFEKRLTECGFNDYDIKFIINELLDKITGIVETQYKN